MTALRLLQHFRSLRAEPPAQPPKAVVIGAATALGSAVAAAARRAGWWVRGTDATQRPQGSDVDQWLSLRIELPSSATTALWLGDMAFDIAVAIAPEWQPAVALLSAAADLMPAGHLIFVLPNDGPMADALRQLAAAVTDGQWLRASVLVGETVDVDSVAALMIQEARRD